MARLIKNRHCVRCGEPNVYMWTLDNTQTAVVTYLCVAHSAPLFEVMDLAGDLPPDEQVPVPVRGEFPMTSTVKGRREAQMKPLLDWTPPEEYLPPAEATS